MTTMGIASLDPSYRSPPIRSQSIIVLTGEIGFDRDPNQKDRSGSAMEGVRYEAPDTLQAAVALLAGATGTARILAGGTDVIVQMETELIEPALLVDIKKIRETRQ